VPGRTGTGARAARAAALGLALLVARGAGADVSPEPPRVGATIRDFEAAPLQGEPLSLKSALAAHKAVVVLFLSSSCPYARYFAPHLRELHERYGPRGVLFLGVDSNRWDTRDEVAEMARQQGFAFPVVKEDGHAIADVLGARATPEAFLLDSEGRLRYRGWVKSRQESPDLQHALDDVLEGRPVRRSETKAFGCAVDRSR
jgi:thiol-disulfide isomerase/thioredoxin